MKKVISILLLVVALAMFMAGCGGTADGTMNSTPETDGVTKSEPQPAPNSEIEPVTAPDVQEVDFEFTSDNRNGTYNKLGFGDEYGVYRFEGTNVVVFNLNTHSGGGWYLIGEDIGETTGVSRGYDVGMKEGSFLALSNKYMLFDTENGKVVKDLIERREEREDGIFLVHDAIPFEELPVEDQEAFVYFCSYEEFSNVE